MNYLVILSERSESKNLKKDPSTTPQCGSAQDDILEEKKYACQSG